MIFSKYCFFSAGCCFKHGVKGYYPNTSPCVSSNLCWRLMYCTLLTVTSLLCWFKCDHSFSTRPSRMFNGESGAFWQIPYLSVYLYYHNKLPLSTDRSQSTVKAAFLCVRCEGTWRREVTALQIYAVLSCVCEIQRTVRSERWSLWPRGLRCGYAAPRLLRFGFETRREYRRLSLVSVVFCQGKIYCFWLNTHPEESYRV